MSTASSAAQPKRRTILRGAAWSVPVVAIAVAAPAFAASGEAKVVAGPGAAVKWGKDANDLWHVSWDLTVTTTGKSVSGVSLTFTYVPTSGRSFDTVDIRGFTPTDTTWTKTINPVTVAGVFGFTSTHGPLANGTFYVHVDFAGLQNNSAGTVQATGTITYTDGSTSPVDIAPVSWSAGSPHAGH
jgi:hypothetical protein